MAVLDFNLGHESSLPIAEQLLDQGNAQLILAEDALGDQNLSQLTRRMRAHLESFADMGCRQGCRNSRSRALTWSRLNAVARLLPASSAI